MALNGKSGCPFLMFRWLGSDDDTLGQPHMFGLCIAEKFAAKQQTGL